MNRFDRTLGLLLLLRGGRVWSATELAGRFGVSARTIYRDVETLSALGVPVYAEMGRTGGFRLLQGYFLPPVMFSLGEAISLLLGLTLLGGLRSKPFAAELGTAEQKLLAAVPEGLRATLAEARKVIGFEAAPGDAFHPEPANPEPATDRAGAPVPGEDGVVGTFLQAVLDRRAVSLRYRSPYRPAAGQVTVEPLGLFWDRDRWYLAGRRLGHAERGETPRLWRADRVLAIEPRSMQVGPDPGFDVRRLLGRAWLGEAMARWREEAPVRIRLTRRQAERLRQDWYYRHADYAWLSEDACVMTFGEGDREVVLELLRWLGPGAELLEPAAWREAFRGELARMLAVYAEPGGADP
jgi:predicted DNA-binding transcriptional regulator YafY